MSDFLTALLARAAAVVDTVAPRLPSRYEPRRHAVAWDLASDPDDAVPDQRYTAIVAPPRSYLHRDSHISHMRRVATGLPEAMAPDTTSPAVAASAPLRPAGLLSDPSPSTVQVTPVPETVPRSPPVPATSLVTASMGVARGTPGIVAVAVPAETGQRSDQSGADIEPVPAATARPRHRVSAPVCSEPTADTARAGARSGRSPPAGTDTDRGVPLAAPETAEPVSRSSRTANRVENRGMAGRLTPVVAVTIAPAVSRQRVTAPFESGTSTIPTTPATPTIHVTIGRIEVRAAAAPAPRPAARSTALSLEQFLAGQGQGRAGPQGSRGPR